MAAPTVQPAPGITFGLLTVLRHEGARRGRRLWRCVCACGRVKVVATRLLTCGRTRSCGRSKCRGQVAARGRGAVE
jgi:hypothetical protein